MFQTNASHLAILLAPTEIYVIQQLEHVCVGVMMHVQIVKHVFQTNALHLAILLALMEILVIQTLEHVCVGVGQLVKRSVLIAFVVVQVEINVHRGLGVFRENVRLAKTRVIVQRVKHAWRTFLEAFQHAVLATQIITAGAITLTITAPKFVLREFVQNAALKILAAMA